MQDNSAMGTQSPGKQDTYFRFFKCLVFNLLTWILWMAIWGYFFWLKEREWALHPPPFCWRAFWGWRCQWVIIQLAMVWTGEWERMSYNFPTTVLVLDWVIELSICCPGLIWLICWSWYGTRTDKVGLGLYRCLFEEFRLKIFKYVCPVWVCCHVNVWVIMHTSGSKSLISSAVSILF